VLATLAAIGLAALAWAASSPLPRLTYNPSDSVAVGWYRVRPAHRLAATSVVRGQHRAGAAPATAAALAAQRGYLPTRVPLLNAWARSRRNTSASSPAGTHRRRAFGRRAACRPAGPAAAILQLCRRLEPGELFLLSVTNPASFDSRYFGPVSASAVIGVAHPVWLETRP
jgi:type IV secretory pathway protease TraF